jgi:lysophospholipase L1-like esterase
VKRLATLCGYCVLSACADPGPGRSPNGDASTPPRVDLSTIRDRSLDSLTPPEAKAMCEVDLARLDFCQERGLSFGTEEECAVATESCRSAQDGGRVAVDCSAFDLGPPGSCTTTVDEYVACVDAWTATRSCKNAGRMIETPPQCRGLLEQCPRLAPEFFQSGAPPPCDGDAGAPPPRPTSADVYGLDHCPPAPSRFVVLGDSIASCLSVDTAHCGPAMLEDYIRTTYAPDLVAESHARPGDVIADLPGQAAQVTPGPGHVAVWAYILGNDLALRHIDYDAWAKAWNQVFDYFTDRTKFPDGVTFLLNTQYSPYDQCPDPLGGASSLSTAADQLLREVNRRMFLDVAERRADTVAVDQYPDWLGHGDNANIRGCPHCGRDNATWMATDRIHPNELGYAHMAAKWKAAVDQMYGPACHGG